MHNKSFESDHVNEAWHNDMFAKLLLICNLYVGRLLSFIKCFSGIFVINSFRISTRMHFDMCQQMSTNITFCA